MISRLVVLSLVTVLFVVSVNAQAEAGGSFVCMQPFSEKFDELLISEEVDLKTKLQEFKAAVSKAPKEAEGLIYVYGGQNRRVAELDELVGTANRILKLDPKDFRSQILVYKSGYRFVPTMELFIKPAACSQRPAPVGDLRADEIAFVEFPDDMTVKLSRYDLVSLIVERPVPECPPAARAVRACVDDTEVDVFILVNTKGEVQFSRSLFGHPLLKASAEAAVKKFKFKPLVQNEVRKNLSGSINIRFKESTIILDGN